MTQRHKHGPVAMAVALFLAAAPAWGQTVPGCNPTVNTALTNSAQAGAQSSTARVRNSYTQPVGLVNLSCLNDILSGMQDVNVLFNFSTFAQALVNKACSAIQQSLGTAATNFDVSRFFAQIPSIPGLTVTPVYGSSGSGLSTTVAVPAPVGGSIGSLLSK